MAPEEPNLHESGWVSRWEYNARHEALDARLRELELFRASNEAKTWIIGRQIAIMLVAIQVGLEILFHVLWGRSGP